MKKCVFSGIIGLLDESANCIGNNRSQAQKIVASTIYAPADRFFRIELSRVNEATIYGISIFWLQPDYSKIKAEAPSNSLLLMKNPHFYVTQIDLL